MKVLEALACRHSARKQKSDLSRYGNGCRIAQVIPERIKHFTAQAAA